MTKQKIFISAYACEPDLGSEIGVGWHWVLEMSNYFELWVLTRRSNQHTIEPWIAEHSEYSCIYTLTYRNGRASGRKGYAEYVRITTFGSGLQIVLYAVQ